MLMFHKWFTCLLVSLFTFLCPRVVALGENKTNLLIITVDDMSCDSVGVYGCKLDETTPSMDSFARTAMRFDFAHVQVGNCMPSRNVMWSGLYPHNNGVEGFYQVKDAKHPHLCDIAKEAGYFTAIRHKVSHSTPYSPYQWDLEVVENSDGKKAHIKDAASYGDSLRQTMDEAVKLNKPFCAVINISDPHKPFYTQVKTGVDPHVPSRVFEGHEVPVPGFLPEDADIRDEVALYYSSVRRADDGVREILATLEETGHNEDTVVMFLSDHGMPLPFAKTQLYHHSTRTPLMVRWPGTTVAGSVDRAHMVSAVDFVPTLCEVLGWEAPDQLDGRSFAPLLKGERQQDRDFVIKEYNENAGGNRNPMRAIETKEYLYIFNPWSDGKLKMATATSGTESWKKMKRLAASNSAIAARVDLMEHRVLEELYHLEADPDCLVNLIDEADHKGAADRLRSLLKNHLLRTKDPILELFANRNDAKLRSRYMERVQSEASARKAKKKKKASATKEPKKSQMQLISWSLQETGAESVSVIVSYELPKELGQQDLFVTIKNPSNKRIERKQSRIEGSGKAEFEFDVSAELVAKKKKLRLAAFVGKDFASNLHYLNATLGKIQAAK